MRTLLLEICNMEIKFMEDLLGKSEYSDSLRERMTTMTEEELDKLQQELHRDTHDIMMLKLRSLLKG